jgi:hypothetical protein
MVAKYLHDDSGITFHVDAALNKDETKYRTFVTQLENMEGIEVCKVGRYFIDAVFGMLFDSEEVGANVMKLFKNTFGVIVVEPLDVHHLFPKQDFPPMSFDGPSDGYVN